MLSSSWTPIGPDLNLSRRKKELKGQLKKTAKIIMPTGTFLFIAHYILINFGPGSLKNFNFIERSQKWLFFTKRYWRVKYSCIVFFVTLGRNVCGRYFEQFILKIS